MFIRDRKCTARDAAEQFARTAFEQPRKVAHFLPNNGITPRFKLVDGTKVYAVLLVSDGWEIVID